MNAIVSLQELAMTFFFGFLTTLVFLIDGVDAVDSDGKLPLYFVRRGLIETEQRILEQYRPASKNYGLALVGNIKIVRVRTKFLFALTTIKVIIQNISAGKGTHI